MLLLSDQQLDKMISKLLQKIGRKPTKLNSYLHKRLDYLLTEKVRRMEERREL